MERGFLFDQKVFYIIMDDFETRIFDATIDFIIEVKIYALYKEYLKEVHNIDFDIIENEGE